MIGQQIGQYVVVRQLGQGGMGIVYEAAHTQLALRAAVKVLQMDNANDPTAVTRFLEEARAASTVHHSSLVRIFDFGRLPDGQVYMMMEYLVGQTLRDRLARGPLPLAPALRLAGQTAAALAAVHEAGIVHCDLKPSNIMLVADREAEGGERVKLLDFGIATRVATEGGTQPRRSGTPLYMSPEQCAGITELNDRADVYALGVVLFEMLTAQHPYDVAGKDRFALRQVHLRDKPRSLQQLLPAASAELCLLINQMLAKDAASRPPMSRVYDRLRELAATALGPPPAAAPSDDTQTSESGSPPSPASDKADELKILRQVLGAVLVVDPDFDAFCMDHYPQIHRRFSATMDRAARESLLLSLAKPEKLIAQLRRIEPRVLGTLPTQTPPGRAWTPGQRAVQPPRAPYDRRWYVSRPEEEEQARDALDYHMPVVFLGPELCGKTWLLHSLLEYARAHSYRIASINLNLVDKSARAMLALFLHKFALRLCKELHLEADEDIDRAFADPHSGPIEALNDIMYAKVLPAIDGPLVLAIDNVDLIAEKPYQDEYFGLLRAWADSGGLWQRLHLVLCISTAPALLVQDVHRSPFNLGDVIAVPDFDRDQLASLAALHDLSCSDEELALLQVQVGGHPYLARLILYEASRRRMPLGALLLRVESDPRGGVFAGYLDHLRSRLHLQPELQAALRSFADNPEATIDPALGRRLEQAGLIVRGAGPAAGYRIRYRLYQRLVQ